MKAMIKPGTMIWLSPAEREAVKFAIAQFYIDCELLGIKPIGEAVVKVKWQAGSEAYEVWIAYTVAGERQISLYYAPGEVSKEGN